MTQLTRTHLDQLENNWDALITGIRRDEDLEIVVHRDRQTVDKSVATILEQLLPRLREYQGNDRRTG